MARGKPWSGSGCSSMRQRVAGRRERGKYKFMIGGWYPVREVQARCWRVGVGAEPNGGDSVQMRSWAPLPTLVAGDLPSTDNQKQGEDPSELCKLCDGKSRAAGKAFGGSILIRIIDTVIEEC